MVLLKDFTDHSITCATAAPFFAVLHEIARVAECTIDQVCVYFAQPPPRYTVPGCTMRSASRVALGRLLFCNLCGFGSG